MDINIRWSATPEKECQEQLTSKVLIETAQSKSQQ